MQASRNKKARIVAAGVGGALYAASLAAPTFHVSSSGFDAGYSGLEAFGVGWAVLCAGLPGSLVDVALDVAWLANPAIWIALIAAACGRWRAAVIAAACGQALCLVSLLVLLGAVADHPGFWLWAGTAAFVLAVSVFAKLREECSGASRA